MFVNWDACRMHDFDNNTKLDGLEILKALTHLLPYEPDDEKKDDVRGKSAEEIAKQKREKELLYYAGDCARVYSMCVYGATWCDVK